MLFNDDSASAEFMERVDEVNATISNRTSHSGKRWIHSVNSVFQNHLRLARIFSDYAGANVRWTKSLTASVMTQ
jgi:hypothetical protein